MDLQISYDEFVRQYFEVAMQYADIEIAKHVKKHGPLNRYVDADDVKSLAVTNSLNNVYMNYDPDNEKGASITTYMRTIVHNSVITELKKASTQVKRNHPELIKKKPNPYELPKYSQITPGVMLKGIDNIKREVHGYMEASGIFDRKEEALKLMLRCLTKLSYEEQVTVNCWMSEDTNYVRKALEVLGIEETTRSAGMIRRKLDLAKGKLQKLMGGVKPDYRDISIDTIYETYIKTV
jgi:DNA-directed RNA polymerase specialized sigma24 family protein